MLTRCTSVLNCRHRLRFLTYHFKINQKNSQILRMCKIRQNLFAFAHNTPEISKFVIICDTIYFILNSHIQILNL